MYKIRTNDQSLVITGGPEIAVAETINVQDCQFIFDKTWANLTVYACFKNQNIIDEAQILLDETYTCKVPASVTMEPGNLYVGLLGVANGNIVKPTVWQRLAIVIQGVSPSGQIVDGNPTAIAELTQIATEALESATEAKDVASQVETEIETRLTQYSTLPIPNESMLGKIVQYIGNTEYERTQGYHYICVYIDDSNTGDTWYTWRQIEREFKEMPTASDYITDPNPIHYIGKTTELEIFNHWYKPIFDSVSSWGWEEYNGR